MKKVTVITGYYNREDCVDETILSLLNQTYDNYEIIAFDDNSTDNTYTKLKMHQSDKLKVIRFNENIGFVNGLIEIIKNLDTEYIAIHGSGDKASSRRIESQAEALDQDLGLVMVGSHILNVDRHNNVSAEVRNKEFISRDDLFKFNQFSHGEIMFRKTTYDKVGGYRAIFKFSQDYDLWFRLLQHGRARILQEILYERIIQFEGVSYKPEKIIRQEQFGVLALEINKLNIQDQKILERKVEDSGISSVIDVKHKLIQKNLFRKYNMLMFKNKLSDTAPFINNSIGMYRIYYLISSQFYNYQYFRNSINKLYNRIYR